MDTFTSPLVFSILTRFAVLIYERLSQFFLHEAEYTLINFVLWPAFSFPYFLRNKKDHLQSSLGQ